MGTQTVVTASSTSVAPPAVRPAARPERLGALDAFRGLAIAAMILVNNPGAWRQAYGPLRHADWDGCTFADLIFPCFLFIVGVAITLSLGDAMRRGELRTRLFVKVLRRTLIILSLGIFLNGFPFFHWSVIRIPGVLQRIALCYCFASLAMLTLDERAQMVLTVLLLIGYWMLMTLVSVPGHGAGELDRGANLAAYIDHALLHGHLLRARWDPEGLLSTLPATATTLVGVLTGRWLRWSRDAATRAVGLFVAGDGAVVLGLIMSLWVPLNKSLWSSSYAVFTAGVALNALGMCYWLIDMQGYRRWATPFVIYGTNPLLAYVLSSLADKATLSWLVTGADGSRVSFKTYVFETCFLPLVSRRHASFLYALLWVLIWLGVMAVLYRRRIFIKI